MPLFRRPRKLTYKERQALNYIAADISEILQRHGYPDENGSDAGYLTYIDPVERAVLLTHYDPYTGHSDYRIIDEYRQILWREFKDRDDINLDTGTDDQNRYALIFRPILKQ